MYFLMLVMSPLLGLIINTLSLKKNPQFGSKAASLGIWIGFITALIAWCIGLPFSKNNEFWGFIANEVSWLMATLILFVSGIVHYFSLQYMAGDKNYRPYFLFLGLITISTLLMVASDNIVILISFWCLCNLLLVLLITHKSLWAAAKNSGILAFKTFLLGLVFLIAGAGLLAYESKTLSLRFVIENSEILASSTRRTALILIMLAAFTQSGSWPFHRWLVSSLNSPTPVSAFMHAGLVNGGGLLLARFAPIFFHEDFLLDILFILAVINLILGGIWKLLQSDIKRMLACSTMTQIGFMLMQCGLGLFSAALAHLCWHSLFKAFLFLKSGSSITEHQRTIEQRIGTAPRFFLSSLCGVIGAIGFIFGSRLKFSLADTTTVLIFFCWVSSTQLAHTLLQKKQTLFLVLKAMVFCLATGCIYGVSVDIIEMVVNRLQISQPHPLNFIHIITITVIFFIWIALNLKSLKDYEGTFLWRRFYVKMLNASQPNPKTITSNRNEYKF